MAKSLEDAASIGGANTGITLGSTLGGTALLGQAIDGTGIFGGLFNGCGNRGVAVATAANEQYLERKECQDYIDATKQFYQGMLMQQEQRFSDRQTIDREMFGLYKSGIDADFLLYKGQRDTKDDLLEKINAVNTKVDMIAAIRPYQDALINCKIDKVADWAAFNLEHKTCKMIEGRVMLPNAPTVTGYPSYNPCACTAASSGGSAAA